MEVLTQILDLVNQYPWIATVLMVIGGLRLVMKPLFSIIRSVVEYTPSPKDNLVFDGVEKHWAVKGMFYVLDWFGSIKLPAKK